MYLFFLFLFSNSIFIYFTTITKQVHTTYINHGHWHWWLCLCSLRVREQTWEYPEETHLSNLVTTWPSHMRHLISNPAVNGERFTTVPVRQPCVSALTTTCNTLSKLIVTSIFHIEQLQILNFSFLYHHTVTV